MSDLQLERSVLEAKERDELFAIAQALGSSPGVRTKKADLVSQILQLTGVEPAPEQAEKPRRTRARKAPALAQEPAQQLDLASSNGGGSNGSRALVGREGAPAEREMASERLNGDQRAASGAVAPGGADEAEPSQAFQRGEGGRQRQDRAEARSDRGDQDMGPGLGNSRRRRRRNREKGARGSESREREFTAQAPETPYS
ncbi:MAG TPA: hypothetical protein VK425_07540, partial [Acidimicrobiales bacterium]|nr:hypothetical protein [Acidimicrobiales bacterium]